MGYLPYFLRSLDLQMLIRKIHVVVPIRRRQIMVDRRTVIRDHTVMVFLLDLDLLIGHKTRLAVKLIHARGKPCRKELGLGVCPLVKPIALDIKRTGRDHSQKHMLIARKHFLIGTEISVIIAEPIRHHQILDMLK